MTTQTQTVAEFVLARIAEDEADAHAEDAPWTARPEDSDELSWSVRGKSGWPVASVSGPDGSDIPGVFAVSDARHIARHDPARVLADCAAKRRIVQDFATFTAVSKVASDVNKGLVMAGIARGLEQAIGALASVYADHPDYRDEWRA